MASEANPFARKPGQTPGNNPFARKLEPQASKATIRKTESFFDKVDAVETDHGKTKRRSFVSYNISYGVHADNKIFCPGSAVSKGKEKEKKEGPRQATLFGMMPGLPKEKEKKAPRKSSTKNKVNGSEAPVGDVLDATETQSTDVTMTEESSNGETLVETQLEETQPSNLQETQPTELEDLGTQTNGLEETQMVESE